MNRLRQGAARERRIYGPHAVGEWLRCRPTQLRSIHYDARAADRAAAVIQLAAAAGVSVRPCDRKALALLAGTAHHQGIVATAEPFPYADLERVLQIQPRLLVVADRIQDPHNLGALLRAAEAGGAAAVVMPRDAAVPVTATVEAVAAGAAAALAVCRVTNLARTLATLKGAGYWVIGLVPRVGRDLFRFDPPQRLVVVVGGETGMRPVVARQCDLRVSIPMFGRTESLNAAVAAAIAIYEIRRKWGELDRK